MFPLSKYVVDKRKFLLDTVTYRNEKDRLKGPRTCTPGPNYRSKTKLIRHCCWSWLRSPPSLVNRIITNNYAILLDFKVLYLTKTSIWCKYTHIFKNKKLFYQEKTLHSTEFFTIRWMSKWRRTWKLFVPMPRIGRKVASDK